MQLLIDQAKLDAALQAAGRIVATRSVAHGVSSVLLQANDGELSLTTTDLQSYATVRLAAEIHAPGAVGVEWQYFARVVSSLSGGEVALSLSGSSRSLRLTSGPSAFRLRTTPIEDFPVLDVPEAWSWTIETRAWTDLIARTTFCSTDSDESSPFFGVSLTAAEGGLKVAATDNYQLAHCAIDIAPFAPLGAGGFAAVLPTRALTALSRALAALGGDEAVFTFSDRKFWLKSGALTWAVRALDTQYPDLGRYVGPLGGVRVVTRRAQLAEAVRQVSSLSDDGRAIGIELDGSRLHMSAAHREVGEAQTFVQLDAEYPKRRVWLDAKRLQNALRAQPADDVALYLSEPLAPVAMAPVDESIRFRTFLTPLRFEAGESEAI